MKNILTKNKKIFYPNRGFTIIEVLIACVIISLTTIALMSATTKGIELSNKALRQAQASMLIEEGIEAVKSIRDNDDNWTVIPSLSLETNYYLSFNLNTNTWSLNTTPEAPIDEIFTRTIVISEVNRDGNDDIASTGTVDDNIKKINVTVSWPDGGTINSKNINFYLTNFFN
ncbi:MAG: prepilin-type N-terminal cleavage/methylation domain-containing protein [Candidatus Paceibacterota bacterium]|jgi:prepilin-type N-terminal cleavage/methylation domain-containing protein